MVTSIVYKRHLGDSLSLAKQRITNDWLKNILPGSLKGIILETELRPVRHTCPLWLSDPFILFCHVKEAFAGGGEIVMELSWKSWEKLFIYVTKEGHLKIGDIPHFRFFPQHIKAKYKIQIVKNNRLPFWPFVGNLEENESGCWESLSWSGGDSQKKTNKCS